MFRSLPILETFIICLCDVGVTSIAARLSRAEALFIGSEDIAPVWFDASPVDDKLPLILSTNLSLCYTIPMHRNERLYSHP